MRLIVVDHLSRLSQDSGKSSLLRATLKLHSSIGQIAVLEIRKSSRVVREQVAKEFPDVVLYSPSFGALDKAIKRARRKPRLWLLKALKSLRDWIIQRHARSRLANQFDLVVSVSTLTSTGGVARKVAQMLSVPFIAVEQDSKAFRRSFFEFEYFELEHVIRDAALICPVSRALGRSLVSGLGCQSDKIFVIPNILSPTFCEAVDAALSKSVNRYKKGGAKIIAGWNNWSREIKRADLALDAVEILLGRNNNVHLFLAGKGTKNLVSEVRRRGIQGSVTLLGPLPHAEIAKLAFAAHVSIVTSDTETFSLPVIESFAAGTPVVATKCGGPEDLLVADYLGVLTETGCSRGLADSIEFILNNPQMFPPAAIRSFVEEAFGEEALRIRWQSAYALAERVSPDSG